MDRTQAKAIHDDITKAMESVAAKHGMAYDGRRLTFDPLSGDVSIRVRLYTPEAKAAADNRVAESSAYAFRIGDEVRLGSERFGTVYKAKEFTRGGCLVVSRVPDGKQFRLKARAVPFVRKLDDVRFRDPSGFPVLDGDV